MKKLMDYLATIVKDPMHKNHVLVVVKPGFENLLGRLCTLFENNGYKIVKSKTKKLLLSEAKQLYKIHSKEDFYKELCEYMSSGTSTAFILKKYSENIFKEFSELKDKIRDEYSISDMKNVIHSSDSYENFTHEASIYFYNVNQKDMLNKKRPF